jgi:hypothetical protein
MTRPAEKVELKPETLLAYTTHIAAAGAAVEARLRGERNSFGTAVPSELHSSGRALRSSILCSGKRPLQVPDGLIHDWIGIVCIPGTTVAKSLALLQDYDNHKNIYQPEVIGSKLIGRQDNDFQIYLRLRKKDHYGDPRHGPRRA